MGRTIYDRRPRPDTVTQLETELVVQEFYDQWNSGAIDFDRLVHPEITNHQPEREPEVGRDAFRKAIEGVMKAVPDSNWTTLRLLAAADLVLCHNRWSGTWNGIVFRGVPTPSGKRFSVDHMHVYRVENRQLVEHWVVRDDLGMMVQIGALPG
jgi:predicted ester cyclase